MIDLSHILTTLLELGEEINDRIIASSDQTEQMALAVAHNALRDEYDRLMERGEDEDVMEALEAVRDELMANLEANDRRA